jgi:hypothetical protein
VILTPDELRELTQRKHADAQAAALRRLGITFRLDGRRPVVLRSTVEMALGGTMRSPREPQLRP